MLDVRHSRGPQVLNRWCSLFPWVIFPAGGPGPGSCSRGVSCAAAPISGTRLPARSPWRRVCSATGACILAASLVGCTSVRPQPRPPPPPIAVKPPPVRIARPPPRQQTVHGNWVFSEDEETCVARISGPHFWLEVTVGSSEITVFLGTSHPTEASARHGPLLRIRFSGLAGNWDISGNRIRGPAVESTLAMNDASLGRVVMMLGGGTVDVPTGPPQLPIFALPAAGREGSAWLRCARQKLL